MSPRSSTFLLSFFALLSAACGDSYERPGDAGPDARPERPVDARAPDDVVRPDDGVRPDDAEPPAPDPDPDADLDAGPADAEPPSPGPDADLDAGPADAGSPFVDGGPYEPGFTEPVACAPRCPTLVAGDQHSCVLRDGLPWCWGANTAGQLGDGTVEPHLVAVRAAAVVSPALSAAVDAEQTCVLDPTGNVRCWGRVRGFGTDPVLPPVRVALDEPAVQVVLRGRHAVALGASGAAWQWGDGFGLELPGDPPRYDPSPSRVPELDDAASVAVSRGHACAVTRDGRVRCWGRSVRGVLGEPLEVAALRAVPLEIAGLTGALDVAASDDASCALLASGTVSCWGSSLAGQLGEELVEPGRPTPAPVSGVSGAVAITAGSSFFCALLGSGAVECWGSLAGALDRATPLAVPGLDDAVELAAGTDHACARRSSGDVLCWGERTGARLGDGSADGSELSVAVVGIDDAVQVTAADAFSCALSAAGTVSCWGLNLFGVLGSVEPATSPVPVAVPGLTGVVEVSAGAFAGSFSESAEWGSHVCALLGDGTVMCWGGNYNGELGEPPGPGRPTPAPVPGIVGALALSAGGAHTCVVGALGEVACWGGNAGLQLGDGSLASLRDVRAIAAGAEGTLAVLADGRVLSWGRIYDSLHFYDAWRSAAPVEMPGVADAVGAAWPSCVIVEGGRVRCWQDYYYAVGGEELPLPADVPGFDDVVELRRGGGRLCARRGDGSVLCRSGSDVVAPVGGVAGAVSLGVGRDHACAALRDGSVRCWGSNRSGELGDGGGGARRDAPVRVLGLP